MLCHLWLCCAILCHAAPFPAMLCHPSNAVLFHAMLCHTLPCCSSSCHAVSFFAMLLHCMPCSDSLCHGVAFYDVLCHSMQYCVVLVTLCNAVHAVACSAEVWASFALLPFLHFSAVPFEAMLCLCCGTPVGQQPFPAVVHAHLLLARCTASSQSTNTGEALKIVCLHRWWTTTHHRVAGY